MPRTTEAVTKPSPRTVAAADTLADAWAKARAALITVERPENSLSVDEYMTKFGVENRSTATGQLLRLTRSGELERFLVTTFDSNGRTRRAYVYRPILK